MVGKRTYRVEFFDGIPKRDTQPVATLTVKAWTRAGATDEAIHRSTDEFIKHPYMVINEVKP